ncbi:MAG: hypothetical protein Q8M07_09450 [Prosthecobacter sp.]|nr:hypothetical protein [Prosthecobacter sp.]
MKITAVSFNNRKRQFDVDVDGKSLSFPYALLELRPQKGNLVAKVWIDQDFGGEGFTYHLKDQSEGSVHIEQVLEFNRDPDYMSELLLYKLSLAVKERLLTNEISQREMIRRLGTSASQYYRLLDPTYTKKSVGQMIGLLHLLGCEVDLVIKNSPAKGKNKIPANV